METNSEHVVERIPQMPRILLNALFNERHYRYIIMKGGRGGGKSESCGMASAIKMSVKKTQFLCGRQYQNSMDESVKAVIEEWIETLAGYESYKHQMSGFDFDKTKIWHKNGSVCKFWGLERKIRSLKSIKGVDVFWGEEASDFTNEVIMKLIPTIRKPGSQFWFTYNPENEDDAVHRIFTLENRYPDDTLNVTINYYDNHFFPDELLQQAKHDKLRNYEEYLHVWEGHTQYISERLIFNGRWKIGKPVPNQDSVFYYGLDFGFANDPLAVLRCWIDEEKKELYIDHAADAVGVQLDDHADFIKRIPGADQWVITADSARPEIIAHLNDPRRGFRVQPAKKGPSSILDGIAFLKNYDIIVHERCEGVIRELATYSYKIDAAKRVIPKPEDKNNHYMDALRYAVEPVRCARIEGAVL